MTLSSPCIGHCSTSNGFYMEVDYQGQKFGLEIGVYLRQLYGDWSTESKDQKPFYCNQATDDSNNRECRNLT